MRDRAYVRLAVGLLVVVVVLASSVMPVLAGGRVFFGVGVGVPLWYPAPWYYPYPYPVYSPPVVVESSPPVYVQQDAPAQSPQQAYSYYGPSSQAYYPYVRECGSGWLQVVPQTAPPPPAAAPR